MPLARLRKISQSTCRTTAMGDPFEDMRNCIAKKSGKPKNTRHGIAASFPAPLGRGGLCGSSCDPDLVKAMPQSRWHPLLEICPQAGEGALEGNLQDLRGPSRLPRFSLAGLLRRKNARAFIASGGDPAFGGMHGPGWAHFRGGGIRCFEEAVGADPGLGGNALLCPPSQTGLGLFRCPL